MDEKEWFQTLPLHKKILYSVAQNSKDKRNCSTEKIVLQKSLFASYLILCSVDRVA